MSDPTAERRDHVLRIRPPWYTDAVTECGRVVGADPGITTINAQQLLWRIKRHGQQRTAFTVCITCWNAANTHRRSSQLDEGGVADAWLNNPVGVLARELQRRLAYDRDDPSVRAHAQLSQAAELHAIAELIEAHRAEYDERCAAARQAIDFRRRRATQERKKAPPAPPGNGYQL